MLQNRKACGSKPVVVMSSGGKDSLLMLARLLDNPGWEIKALLTTVNERNGRVAMHGTSRELLQGQSDAVGLPLITVELPEDGDNRTYEQRLANGLRPLAEAGIRHVACGDLFLADIRQWREALFKRLGWQPIFPLWQEPTDKLATRLIDEGWQLTLTCVDTEQLSAKFLGRRFDQSLLDDLPETVDPCGERGEFHSFVHDGPIFTRPLSVKPGRVVTTHDRFAMLELIESDCSDVP